MGVLSKGCGSCKRRKVKCDETRPKCSRCCNAGIECAGFATRLRFVDEKPRIQRSIAVSHAQSHEFATVPRSSHLAFHSNRIPKSQGLSPGPFLTTTLPLTAFKDEIFISFLLSKLFEEDYEFPLSIAVEACGLPTKWISELVNTPQNPRSKAWDSLAAILFGQAHKSYDAIMKAHRLYGQALLELRNELSNPASRCSESTLASITALYTYEILVFETDKGWLSHANGLGWLLEGRGPWQQKSYSGKSIFLDHRIMLIAKSIVYRQSTFLRDPIWKTVPWEDNPASKSSNDYLVDIGTGIVECIAQVKTYDNSKTNEKLMCSELIAQVAASLEELNTWWHRWEAEHPQPATEVASHQATTKPLFPVILEYDALSTAFTICLYDAMRILLLQLWHTLQSFPNTGDQDVILDMPNRTALLGITSDTKGLACEILRSLEYAYGESRRIVNSFTFLFIQDVAYGCFDQGSREATWIAGHGWAEFAKLDDVENANLLKRLFPLGQIKVP